MQLNKIMMFESRKEFRDWLVASDLAITEKEIAEVEKKTCKLLPPLAEIETYEDFVNYYQCDNMQTIIWVTEDEDGEKKMNALPIFITSDKL